MRPAILALSLAAHVSDFVGLETAFASKQRTIEHLDNYLQLMGAEETPVTDEMLARAVEATLNSESGVTPTMALWEHFGGEPQSLFAFDELKYLPSDTVAAWRKTD